MTEKIYLNIYRSGHVLVSALNVCEIKSPLVHQAMGADKQQMIEEDA